LINNINGIAASNGPVGCCGVKHLAQLLLDVDRYLARYFCERVQIILKKQCVKPI
jgi:hypothetical protein